MVHHFLSLQAKRSCDSGARGCVCVLAEDHNRADTRLSRTQELLAFARALGELVHAPELKAFWVLELDADERDTADVFVRVLRSLEQCIAVLQAATATTAEVSTHIAGKRDVRCDML